MGPLYIEKPYRILFSNLKQKRDYIIINRVISSHIGPRYIETPNTNEKY